MDFITKLRLTFLYFISNLKINQNEYKGCHQSSTFQLKGVKAWSVKLCLNGGKLSIDHKSREIGLISRICT